MSMAYPGVTHCPNCWEKIGRCNCYKDITSHQQVPKLKLIDVLVMISKGELKEDYRTEIKINGVYYKLFSQETAENLFSELFNHLNDECILIRYEGKNTEKIKELDNYEWQEGIMIIK